VRIVLWAVGVPFSCLPLRTVSEKWTPTALGCAWVKCILVLGWGLNGEDKSNFYEE